MPLRKKEQRNLLELIPERLFDSFENDEGKVVVQMPRFHIAWMQKYLVPSRRDPFIKVTLDAIGSGTWRLIDGKADVDTIAQTLKTQFGDEVEPLYERLSVFFHTLERRGFLRFRNRSGEIVK